MQTVTLSKEMALIIEQAYQVFSYYPVPQTFDVCMPCCVSPEDERALRRTPLRNVSFHLLSEYNQSASLSEQSCDEIRYLLPRLLEIIAYGEYPAISEELSLARVGRANLASWKPEEQRLLNDFAKQFLNDLLDNAQNNAQLAELDSQLIMFHRAGLDIQQLLTSISQSPDYYRIASLAFYLIMKRSNGCLSNAFASDDSQLNLKINQWIEQNLLRLSELAEIAIESAQPKLTNDAYYCGATLGYWMEQGLCSMSDCCIS